MSFLIDSELLLKFRGIVKAVMEVEDIDLDVVKLARRLCSLSDLDQDIRQLVDYTHACREDAVTFELLAEIMYHARNPYVKYDKETYNRIKDLLSR